jgi:hypothetical protein
MNLKLLIADKIEEDPAVVETALVTLKKWEALGEVPAPRLRQWRRVLLKASKGRSGIEALTRILRDDSEKSRRMCEFAPFAGILTREERRKVFLKCVYDH